MLLFHLLLFQCEWAALKTTQSWGSMSIIAHAKKLRLKPKIADMGPLIKCDLCEALVQELHAELHRHEIVSREGEEGVLDSVEPVCLAIVQNYRLSTSVHWGSSVGGTSSYVNDNTSYVNDNSSYVNDTTSYVNDTTTSADDTTSSVDGDVSSRAQAGSHSGSAQAGSHLGSARPGTARPGSQHPISTYRLVKSEAPSDDDNDDDAREADMESAALRLESAIRLKEICLDYADEVAIDLAEVMYQSVVNSQSATDATKQFCWSRKLNPCTRSSISLGANELALAETKRRKKKKRNNNNKKKRKHSKKNKSKHEDGDPSKLAVGMESYFEMIQTNPRIKNMLTQEFEDPTISLPESVRKEIKIGSEALRCEICEESVSQLLHRLRQKRSGWAAFSDEALITREASTLCSVFAVPETSFEIKMAEIAPQPPQSAPWMDLYQCWKEENGSWVLKRLDKLEQKRGGQEKDVDSSIVRSKHILRQACEDTVASNSDLLGEIIYNMYKDSQCSTSSSNEVCDLDSISNSREVCASAAQCRYDNNSSQLNHVGKHDNSKKLKSEL